MKVIVITGGIGSGKSAVSAILETKGIPVYDCDSKAKALYGKYPRLKTLLTEDLFTNAEALERLETALFPLLLQDFREWAEKKGRELVGFESATVLSKTFFDGFGDYVVYVDAPEALRLERAIRRGGISRESLLQRMALQGDYSGDPRVSFKISNDSDMRNLEKQIDDFLNTL